MVQENSERLKKYLDMISRREGGVEGVMHKLAARRRPGRRASRDAPAGPSRRKPATAALESAARRKDIPPGDYAHLEAIIFEDIRPAIDIVDGTFTVTHPLWTQLSSDAAIKARIEAAIPLVGRIELPGNTRIPYGGTGFVVGPGLDHDQPPRRRTVRRGAGRQAPVVQDGRGRRPRPQARARPAGGDGARRAQGGDDPSLLGHGAACRRRASSGKPLSFGLADARELAGRDIFIVGYPAFDPRNPASGQQNVFEGRYGVKRLQPGQLQGGVETSSFGKLVPAATHDVSTLGGNSGSAIFDLDTGEVLGLHFGGRYHERNYAVPAAALSRDDRVIAAGVTFAGKPPGGQTEWSGWWLRADAAEARVAARHDTAAGPERRPAGSRRRNPGPVGLDPGRQRGHRRAAAHHDFARCGGAGHGGAGHGRRGHHRGAARAGPRHRLLDAQGIRSGLPQRSRAKACAARRSDAKAGERQGAGEDPRRRTPCCTTRIFRSPCMPSAGWRCLRPVTSPRRRS